MSVVVIYFVANFTAALEHKHVDSSVNNVTVGGKYSDLSLIYDTRKL